MIRLGLVGCGHWGTNYLRIFRLMEGVEVVTVSDVKPEPLAKVRKQYPSIQTPGDFSKVLEDPKIDGIVIATPASTHNAFIRSSLQARKHVLVEKPLALEETQSRALVELADTSRRILMVGHTFLYNPAVRKMKEIIEKGVLGKIYYLHATRTHLGLIRDDVSALWDLAPHDVSIFSYLLDQEPRKVSAIGTACLKEGIPDVAFINLFYADGIIGNIHLSWVDSNKLRQVAVVGSKARVLFDDLNTLERIRIFEKGVSIDKPYENFGEFQLLLRDGDIISPKVTAEEPLRNVCNEFIDSIRTGKRPLADARNGHRVVRTLCAMQKSIQSEGEPVLVEEEETPLPSRGRQ
ncbi:MAG: Gfo/Idh/MocA family oxidoreductase [Candidatus Omnitrophica bacterium]|nr:Gfo/Idh/MocA family oxidoreductase [Candidatus Omnitrophota bacterium]